MTKDELVQKLKDMRGAAKHGEMGVMEVLFGVAFADDIEASGANGAEISREAGLKVDIEVNYGRRLAQYVTVNPAGRDRCRPAEDNRRR